MRLPAHLHPSVAPLYERSGLCFPLIHAVIARLQRGTIWVDDSTRPRAAFVVTGFGFTCYLGEEGLDPFDSFLREALVVEAGASPRYLLWYAPPPGWSAWLERREAGTFRRRERVRLLPKAGEPAFLDEAESGLGAFRLQPLDHRLIPEVDKLGLDIGSRFWSSASELLESGLGACLVAPDGSVASVCYASCVAGNLAEVDVATREDQRGRGLASVVARELVRQCRRRQIVPAWDCFTANQASMKLAVSLGFVELVRYPLYSFQAHLPM